MAEEHWAPEFEHPSVTTENREAFNTHMAKFTSQADAVMDGYGLATQKGKPFKMPESLDKLPDDKTRGEFRSGALKVLGSVDNVDALKDFNFSAGRPEGYEMTEADTAVAASFSQFVVEKNVPLSMATGMVEFYNTMMTKARQDIDNQYIDQAKVTNAKMLDVLNGEDNVVKHAESIVALFNNHAGLTAEEIKDLPDALVENKFPHSIVLQKALGNIAAKLVTEGTTEGGGGGGGGGEHKQTPYEWKKARWPDTPSMWGKPDDKLEDQSVEIRKRLEVKNKP